MIAHILLETGADPTFLVGGEIRGLEANARRGAGEWLVAEADEYDRSFLHLHPEIAVITNVEADHLDIYPSVAEIRSTFLQFARQVGRQLVLCYDDPWLREWGADDVAAGIERYGLAGGEWCAEDVRLEGEGSAFRLVHTESTTVRLRVPGRHNVQNAVGALAAASAAGVPLAAAGEALATFRGAKRRLEPVGEANGVLVIDDYSHHPTEIRVALAALRAAYPGRRVVCLHQPHTYSRTKLLLHDFATAFDDADVVRIADIYPAREQDRWGVSSADLVAALRHPNVRATGSVEESAAAVAAEVRPGDVLALIGAGDINRAAGPILRRLAE
jgi:UDP-N-acetylmuramate--alanine ligase